MKALVLPKYSETGNKVKVFMLFSETWMFGLDEMPVFAEMLTKVVDCLAFIYERVTLHNNPYALTVPKKEKRSLRLP